MDLLLDSKLARASCVSLVLWTCYVTQSSNFRNVTLTLATPLPQRALGRPHEGEEQVAVPAGTAVVQWNKLASLGFSFGLRLV